MLTRASLIETPDCWRAAANASLIAKEAESTLTTTPFLIPAEGEDVIERISMPSSVISATTTLILEVPASMPVIKGPLFFLLAGMFSCLTPCHFFIALLMSVIFLFRLFPALIRFRFALVFRLLDSLLQRLNHDPVRESEIYIFYRHIPLPKFIPDKVEFLELPSEVPLTDLDRNAIYLHGDIFGSCSGKLDVSSMGCHFSFIQGPRQFDRVVISLFVGCRVNLHHRQKIDRFRLYLFQAQAVTVDKAGCFIHL